MISAELQCIHLFLFFLYIRFILAKLSGESVVKGCKSGHDSF